MIYLIGGPVRTGKTTLAEALAKAKYVPYFSLDHVTSVITPYIPKQEYNSKFPLSAARKDTGYSNDAFYKKYSSKKIVELYLHQAETCWPGVESFIRYALSDNHDLILEGWQILPHLVHKVRTPENQERLKTVFLYKTDVDDILAGIKSNVAKNDWAVKNTREESTFLAIAQMVSLFGGHIRDEAEKYKFQAVNMDFEFGQKIEQLMKSV